MICSVLCFGSLTSVVIATVAGFIALRERRPAPVRPVLPAAMLFLLLAPGIALQSYGTSWGVFATWLVGAMVGSYAGVAAGLRLGMLVRRAD